MLEYLLGIDNGGTLIKAVLFDLNGNVIAGASGSTPLITPHSGYTERDMETLWEANCCAIKELLQKSAVNPAEIIGVSLSGHGKGLYLWGKDEKPAYNGIVSTDSRAYKYPQNWEKDGTADKVFGKTFQKILACQPVSLLRWFKDNAPEVIENTKWIFGVKDYLRYRLTGEAYAEITDISGSSLVNIKDVKYDKELLKEYGLEEIYDKLPPLKYSTELCGRITKQAAEKTGLAEGTPVAGGLFDIDACAVAMNITSDEYIACIAGTWSINEYISKTPVLDKSVMMNSLFCLPQYYLIEECSPTSASNYEWFINMFMGEQKEEAAKRKMSVFKLVDEMAASVKPDEQNIIFLPYIYGSNYNPQAKASLIGADSHHTKAQIARAVLEGIVFCHMVHIEKLFINKKDAKGIRLAGGAANSDMWVQIFADVINLPVEIIEASELGTLGAAMAAGVCAGKFADLNKAAENMVKIKKVVKPITANAEIYKKKFELYKKVADNMDKIWDEFYKV